MSMKYTDLHYGQIPTLYQALKSELSKSGTAAIFSLLRCFTYDVDSNDYMIQVLLTANDLERISCLVYKSSDRKYKKLSENKYKKVIFESYAETPQEIYDRIHKYGVSETEVEWIHKMIWQIADLVCPMIACIHPHGASRRSPLRTPPRALPSGSAGIHTGQSDAPYSRWSCIQGP